MPKPLKITTHDDMPPAGTPTHPDVLTAAEAVRYLRIDEATPTQAAAHALLDRLVQHGQLAGLTWAARRLYSRPQLDAMLARSIEAEEPGRLEKLDRHENPRPADPNGF